MRLKSSRLIPVPFLVWLAMGCSSVLLPEPPLPTGGLSGPDSIAPVESFSAERAWAHLEALTEIGARYAGSDGNLRAQNYIEGQLESMGLEVEFGKVVFRDFEEESPDSDPREVVVTNLSARIPGTQSEDRFILVAPFDSQYFADFEFVGANDGASGASVVLELTRALVDRPLEYATEIVFVDGEAPFTPGVLPTDGGHRYRGAGRQALALNIQGSDSSKVRMMLYLNRVGDADLQIARDLMSHRTYREVFWDVAEDLGQTDAFAPDAAFVNAGVDYPILNRIGFRRIVSIVDTIYGGDQPPGVYSGTEEDTLERCSAESLDTVGKVSLAALHSISRRLMKIDLFARMPDKAGGAEAVSETDQGAAVDQQDDPVVDPPPDDPATSWEDEQEEATGMQEMLSADVEEATP